jgi:hypothetical protein
MTMQNLPHPDDERLAAYAGGDPDALADGTLAAHLSACDRCRPLVDELSLLRGALAELPDLAPSRPLRLIPPVPAAPDRGSWLRRLTAPAMAAGAGLILVGAIGVGATGAIGSFFGQAASQIFANVGDNLQGAGAPEVEATASEREGVPIAGADSPSLAPEDTTGNNGYQRSAPPRTVTSSPTSVPAASSDDGGKAQELNSESSPEQPWLTLLIAGAGLFAVSAALRVSISPRAG